MEARKYRLEVRTTIRPERGPGLAPSGDELNVYDEVMIDASNFAEIARILGEFHDLADRLRSGRNLEAAAPRPFMVGTEFIADGERIYPVQGGYVAADGAGWIPGLFESIHEARRAQGRE